MNFKADKIEQVRLSDIKKDPRNSRTHSDHQILQIANSIREFGFLIPILLDNDNQLIAGEGRVEGAHLLKMETVPAIRAEHLSDRQRRAFALADNKIAMNAGWNFEILSEELSELAALDFDLNITGFDEQEIDSLLKDDPSILPETTDPKIKVKEHERTTKQNPKKEKPITCPHCGEEISGI
jgi:ParB-like chromosome segregation protein Spo0J